MPIRHRPKPKRGRPRGAASFHAPSAVAFGTVVREARLEAGISQEALAYMANVERSYLGRIERGLSQPTLYLIFKVAAALAYDAATLIDFVQKTMVEPDE